jgi:hypothetical protein
VVNGKQNPLITISVQNIPDPSTTGQQRLDQPVCRLGRHVRVRHHPHVLPDADRDPQFAARRRRPPISSSPPAQPLDSNNPTDVSGVSIENPIGTTIIDNQRGDIVVSSSPEPVFQLLRTNVLTLNADGGSIGTHTTSNGVITSRRPIPIELVQHADDRGLQPITITVEAGNDAVPICAPFAARRPRPARWRSPWVPSAGRDADQFIRDTVEELTPGLIGAVKVLLLGVRSASQNRRCSASRLVTRARTTATLTGPARSASTTAISDPIRAASTPTRRIRRHRTTVHSDYTFADIRAGNDISIQHVRNFAVA